MSKSIKLSKPINDGKISEITLREPTYGDLQRHGLPFDAKGNIDFAASAGLVEACSGVQAPFLKAMNVKDTLKVIEVLSSYLADDEGNSED